MTRRTENFLMVTVFAAIVAALYIVPRLIPTGDADVINAAAAVGYNTSAAFWTVIIWFVLAISLFALPTMMQRLGSGEVGMPANESMHAFRKIKPPGKLIWVELGGVFIIFALAYFPLFLARHGPYMEDIYFLVTLQRMECGQLPYVDFAFSYGPMMIYPLWGWCQLFGTSMVSYFGFLSLIEGLQFAMLMGVLQFFIPERKTRYWVFLLLLPFLFNTLLGLNYNGLRRLIPALAILLVAYRPFDRKANLLCAFLIAFQLAYSHEYAIPALLGVLGIYAATFFRSERVASVRAAVLIVSVSVVVWAAIMLLALNTNVLAFVASVGDVAGMMSRGHAGFRFYWTANSLALFALLTIAIGTVGKGLVSKQRDDMLPGDRLMIGAVICAVVMLKSGLTRSDLWHMNAGFLTLLFAFLLPLSSRVMTITDTRRKIAMVLMIVASSTYLIGIAPTGSLYATSYLKGLTDTLAGRSTSIPIETRGPSVEFERTMPRTHFVALGKYLAAPGRVDLPVLFYGQAWSIAPLVGVCSEDYKLDDLMYSEFRRPESAYLEENPNALIVLRTEDYETLYGVATANAPVSRRKMTPTKQLARWLSTVHYDAADVENRLQVAARMRLTGSRFPVTHHRTAKFGDYIVLAPQ